jgi:hypothetical protein
VFENARIRHERSTGKEVYPKNPPSKSVDKLRLGSPPEEPLEPSGARIILQIEKFPTFLIAWADMQM